MEERSYEKAIDDEEKEALSDSHRLKAIIKLDTDNQRNSNGISHEQIDSNDIEEEKLSDEFKQVLLTGAIKQNVKVSASLCPGLLSFVKSYRSSNPQSKVTPFAVVLLLVLFSLYCLNQADRLVLAVLIPSGLQCERNISNDTCLQSSDKDNMTSSMSLSDCIEFNDAEQGLLTGPAFTVIYVLAGLPLAWLADTKSRPLVLLGGIAFWSTIMFLNGFVKTFWQLLLLRVFLGVGEASYNPVAYSLMADFFPPKNRAFVLSIYHYGVYLGGGFGWMSGAINNILEWRWTFRLLGIAGFVFLPLAALAIWEPKQIRERRKERIKGKKTYTIWEVFNYLIRCPPYLMLLVAGSIRNIPGYALGAWLPTYYARAFGLSSSHYGIKVGFVVIFGGGIGCFVGGLLSDWLSRYRTGAKAYVIAFSQALAAPSILGVLMAPSPTISYGILFIAYITAETWLGPAAAIVQDVCMPAMRAQASAVYIGVITMVASIGPVLVPAFLHQVPSFSNCIGIRYALLCTVPTLYILSSILFGILGIVMQCWVTKQKIRHGNYYTFTDEVEREGTASSPSDSDGTGIGSKSNKSSEW